MTLFYVGYKEDFEIRTLLHLNLKFFFTKIVATANLCPNNCSIVL